jgi:hypothetical protein
MDKFSNIESPEMERAKGGKISGKKLMEGLATPGLGSESAKRVATTKWKNRKGVKP